MYWDGMLNGRARFEEMLREAEIERRSRQLPRRPSPLSQWISARSLQVGRWLEGLGKTVQERAEANLIVGRSPLPKS